MSRWSSTCRGGSAASSRSAKIPILRNGVQIRVVHLYRGIDQTAPFPFGNARKTAPQRLETAALGTPQFGWMRIEPSVKIRVPHPRLNEVRKGCKQCQLQGMKQTMWKHQRSVRNCSLGVEDLEDRFLLSGGGSVVERASAAQPAVQVQSEPRAPDYPEDEPPFSAASSGSRADNDPHDASDLTVAHAAATSGARTATATRAIRARRGGRSSSFEPVPTSVRSSSPPPPARPRRRSPPRLVHPPSLPVAGSLGGDRPNGILLSDEDAVERLEPGLPAATRVRPFGPSPETISGPPAPSRWRIPRRRDPTAIAPPRGFGLIGETLPFVRTSLEQAVARFLTRIEGLSASRSGWQESPSRWVPWLVLTVAAGAGAVALRRRWRADDGDGEDRDDPRGADRPARTPRGAQPPLIETS